MKNGEIMQVKIHEELEKHIWPLKSEEYELLEQSILADGIRDKLITWHGYIVDGHNRYKIAQEHGLTFETLEKEFADIEAVKDWMDANQLARRNLTRDQWEITIGRRYNREKKDYGGDRSKWQNLPLEKTETKLAEEYKISPKTVRNYAKKSNEFERLREEQPEAARAIADGEKTIKEVKWEAKKEKQKEREQKKANQARKSSFQPTAEHRDYKDWLLEQDFCDLLLTDPPYSTDIEDIYKFAAEWLPLALNKVKSTGRAYVFIGAYPDELAAYLAVKKPNQILVWTYQNTLGPTPKFDYKLNWQAILYYRMPEAPPLDSPIMLEQFSVQNISAPDGRQGDRYHQWQKPLEIAERFIRHSTKEGGLILDPFCCTGSFLLAGAKLNRIAKGCDISRENLRIAEERGCTIITK
jgi:DNA modification methylase